MQARASSGLEAEVLHQGDRALGPVSCAELLLCSSRPAGLDPDSSSFSAYHFPALQILGPTQAEAAQICLHTGSKLFSCCTKQSETR